jgi:hypothetical protein
MRVVQTPNGFGHRHDVTAIADARHRAAPC